MTKQEFIERVNVNVTNEEYEHIEAVYMASDVDKDTFCKMWRQINKSRVKAAKAEAKERSQKEDDMMFLWGVINTRHQKFEYAAKTYDSKTIDRLEDMGIAGQFTTSIVYGAIQKMNELREKAA